MIDYKTLQKSLFIVIIITIISVTVIFAYDISWWTIDGGSNTSSGGSYSLSGTTGQPDSGILTGGTYKLEGGFWVFAPGATFADIWYLY